jgi:hypothetical protein
LDLLPNPAVGVASVDEEKISFFTFSFCASSLSNSNDRKDPDMSGATDDKKGMDDILKELTKHQDKASLSRSLSGFSPDVIEAAREFDDCSHRLQHVCNELQRVTTDYQDKCRRLQSTILNTSPATIVTPSVQSTPKDLEIRKLKMKNSDLMQENTNKWISYCAVGFGVGFVIGTVSTVIFGGIYSWMK